MKLSFEVSPKLIESQQRLDNALARAYADLNTSSQDELEAINHYARISTIGASTRIENAQLTDIEVNWLDTILTTDGKTTALENNRSLIENKLSKDRERSIEEVAGCRAMLMLIYANPNDFFPLRESDIRALHYELMSPYQKAQQYSGVYKVQSNSVVEENHATGARRLVFATADPGPITNAAMKNLVDWYNETQPLNPWPLAVTCELVYRFLAIHPFQDGNGRLGRGLFLLSLLQSKSETLAFVARYLAIDRCIEKNKEEYYMVLNRCSDGQFKQDPHEYKLEYFLQYMTKIMLEAIELITILKKRFQAEQNLSPTAHQVLQCFRDFPEIRLGVGQITDQTSIPRRTATYALASLLEAGLIQKYGQGAGTKYQLTF